jgi:hypothetical protein
MAGGNKNHSPKVKKRKAQAEAAAERARAAKKAQYRRPNAS